MRRECRERFPRNRLQRKPLVSDPGMLHGTSITHVPWCMSGSLTSGGGENGPDKRPMELTYDVVKLCEAVNELEIRLQIGVCVPFIPGGAGWFESHDVDVIGTADVPVCSPAVITSRVTQDEFVLADTEQHDDVIKWKHFPRNWPFVREIHRSPVNFPHKGQWRGALMFSLNYAWINDWVNNREAGDLRRQHGHYDVIVMTRITHWTYQRRLFLFL